MGDDSKILDAGDRRLIMPHWTGKEPTLQIGELDGQVVLILGEVACKMQVGTAMQVVEELLKLVHDLKARAAKERTRTPEVGR